MPNVKKQKYTKDTTTITEIPPERMGQAALDHMWASGQWEPGTMSPPKAKIKTKAGQRKQKTR